jgi:hypothetical protein
MAVHQLRPLARLPIAAAVAALLAAAPAYSVEIATLNWASNTADYNLYAATCEQATGSSTTCGSGSVPQYPGSSQATNTDPQTDRAIYAYAAEDVNGINSVYEFTNTLGYAFKLTSVTLSGIAPVGTPPTGLPDGNQVGMSQGQGILATWELNPDMRFGWLSDARAKLYGTLGADPVSRVDGLLIATDPWTSSPLADTTPATWWCADGNSCTPTSPDQPNPALTPVNLTLTAAGETIAANDSFAIQIYDIYEDAPGQGLPNAIIGPLAIVIEGERAELAATNVNFGNVRVGTSASPANTTVSNSGGLEASGVALERDGTPVSQFTPPTTQTLGTVAASGNNTSGNFGFVPTVIGASYADTVMVTSTDALGTSLGLTGRGVGPQIVAGDMNSGAQYAGSAIDSMVLDFGATPTNAPRQTSILLLNAFGEDLATLTDLTVKLALGGDAEHAFLVRVILGNGQVIDLGDEFVLADLSSTSPSDLLTALLEITFDPILTGASYDAEILIDNDQGFALGTLGTQYTINLLGSGIKPVPLPGTLVLMGFGLAALRLVRRGACSVIAR